MVPNLKFMPFRCTAALFSLILGLSLCGVGFSGEALRSATPPVQVRVGASGFGIDYLPIVIAKEKGFYREEALNVEWIVIAPRAAITAIVSGEIDFNPMLGSALGAASQGLPIKAIMVFNQKPGHWLLSKPEIRSISELVGRTVAVGNVGSLSHIQSLFILENFGLAGKVHTLTQSGGTREAALALMAGRVDASYANSDTYFQLKDKGFRELVNYADHIVSPSSGVATSQNLIDTKPDIVQRFVNASYRGMLFLKENRTESIKLLAKFQKKDEKEVAPIYDLEVPRFGGDGTVPCQPIVRELQAREKIMDLKPQIVDCNMLIDNRFSRKVTGQKRPQ